MEPETEKDQKNVEICEQMKQDGKNQVNVEDKCYKDMEREMHGV